MHTLPFVKMQGLGNDYVYIDCFSRETGSYIAKTDIPDLARRISDRHTGVGSDGLVLILPSEGADARMRMFNAGRLGSADVRKCYPLCRQVSVRERLG